MHTHMGNPYCLRMCVRASDLWIASCIRVPELDSFGVEGERTGCGPQEETLRSACHVTCSG